jgi:hypothetical protein
MINDRINLRPHHILTLKIGIEKEAEEIIKYFTNLRFKNKQGKLFNCYDEESATDISKTFSKLSTNPKSIIKIIKTPDYICEKCLGYKEGNCTFYPEDKLSFEDNRVIRDIFPNLENKIQTTVLEIINHEMSRMDSFYPTTSSSKSN